MSEHLEEVWEGTQEQLDRWAKRARISGFGRLEDDGSITIGYWDKSRPVRCRVGDTLSHKWGGKVMVRVNEEENDGCT